MASLWRVSCLRHRAETYVSDGQVAVLPPSDKSSQFINESFAAMLPAAAADFVIYQLYPHGSTRINGISWP
jgi:hypothetical protein